MTIVVTTDAAADYRDARDTLVRTVPLVATTDAATDYLAARAALVRAIDFDYDHGLTANQIAANVTGCLGRDTVYSYLAYRTLTAAARAAVRDAGLGSMLGVECANPSALNGRRVILVLVCDPAEFDRPWDEIERLALAALADAAILPTLPPGVTLADALADENGVVLRSAPDNRPTR